MAKRHTGIYRLDAAISHLDMAVEELARAIGSTSELGEKDKNYVKKMMDKIATLADDLVLEFQDWD